MLEWGMKAGSFLGGVQVGALKNWTLHEKYDVLSRDPNGGPSVQKTIGWTASALRYIINRDLTDKDLEFRFCSIRSEFRICKGKITSKYIVKKPVDGPIEMEGDTAPKLIWR